MNKNRPELESCTEENPPVHCPSSYTCRTFPDRRQSKLHVQSAELVIKLYPFLKYCTPVTSLVFSNQELTDLAVLLSQNLVRRSLPPVAKSSGLIGFTSRALTIALCSLKSISTLSLWMSQR